MINAITQSRLKELLHYDAETGRFVWRLQRFTRRAGAEAGCLNKRGYHVIMIDKVQFYAHHLAWIYVHGDGPVPDEIDHKDRNRANNRFSNLRPATRSLNQANKSLSSANSSGFKGVSFNKKREKWRAEIQVNGKRLWLGGYDHPEDAHAAYAAAAHKHFGAYAHCAKARA